MQPKTLVIASHNASKIREFEQAFADLPYFITSAAALGLDDIAEGDTSFDDNALLKARVVAKATGHLALADDSGLVIPALDGFPGVITARYSKDVGGYEAGTKDLLRRLGVEETPAAYICVLAFVGPDGAEKTVEGRVDGVLTWPARGTKTGFGYDPWFVPSGYDSSFADMSLAEKQRISHRGRALAALMVQLQKAA